MKISLIWEYIQPKSVAREMFETYTSFDDYVRRYGLARSEGALLRYLVQVHDTLRKIEQQAFRASGIASSLLSFSRPGDGDHRVLDLDEVVTETLQLFEPHLHGLPIKLKHAIDGPLPPVTGNRGRLQQVLMNLLLNAVDAMPDGGDVTLRAASRSGRVTIEIADTGVGIPREHLERIYDPFFTTKPRGKGTGLGLSLSYGIVKEHAGTLTAESRPGEGSRFTVSLPAGTAGKRGVTV